MVSYPICVTRVTIGPTLYTEAIIYVAEKAITSKGGDFIYPRTVGNLIPPVGVGHNHKWWEVTIVFDEDDEELLFDQMIIVFNNGMYPAATSVSTLGEGVAVPTSLIVKQKRSVDSKWRIVTYTSVYVKNWNSKIVNGEDHQPTEVTFLSYGSRTAGSWT